MGALETIATIFVVLGVIKILYLLIKPSAWMGFAKKIYARPLLTQVVFFILAAVIFYYLIQVLNIVEIFAVMAFTSMLIGIGFASFGNKIIKNFKLKTMWRDYWFYTLIWIVLMVWAISALI